jgi:hypothetical protein
VDSGGQATATGTVTEHSSESRPVDLATNTIARSMGPSILQMQAATVAQVAQPVYGFDRQIWEVAEEWASRTTDPEIQEFLAVMAPAARIFCQPSTVIDALRRMPVSGEAEHMMVVGALYAVAYNGNAPVEEIWNLLNDDTWRENVLQNSSERALQALAKVCTDILSRVGGKWRVQLPHLFASACEKAIDAERRELLFDLTVTMCLISTTDSAIHRLLRRPAASIVQAAKAWRERLSKISPSLSPWARARIRGVTAALNIG